VMHSHGSVHRQLTLLREVLELDADDLFYVIIPLFTLHGFLPLAGSSVHNQGTVVLSDRFDPAQLAAASRRFDITYLTTAAPMLAAILQLPEADRPTLHAMRSLTSGGASLHPDTKERFEHALGVRVSQGYAMTEMLGAFVGDYKGGAPRGSCGRLYPEGSDVMVVLDDDGQRLPAGEVGEFALDPSVALLGYWNRPDLDDELFRDGWFRTGDIGRIDADGSFWVLDRKKDMIIRGGFNIYSAEIERVLNQHDLVAEATVVGAPHDRLGEVPMAYVVLTSEVADAAATAEDLRAYARARLGGLKTPESITIVKYDDLPRNAINKVLKRELRERAARS